MVPGLEKNRAIKAGKPVDCNLAEPELYRFGVRGIITMEKVRWREMNGGRACEGLEEGHPWRLKHRGWCLTAMEETGLLHLAGGVVTVLSTMAGILTWRWFQERKEEKMHLPKYC